MKYLTIHLFIAVLALSLQPTVDASESEFEDKLRWQVEQETAELTRFRGAFVAALAGEDSAALLLLFSPGFDGADKTISFLNSLISEHGTIEKLRFKYFDRKKQRRNAVRMAVFHCEFQDNVWLNLRVQLDDSGRVMRLIMTDVNYNEALPHVDSRAVLQWPFEAGDEWYVLWGGVSEDMNYHVTARSQRNALDLLIRHPFSHESFKGEGGNNGDYYAFGKLILSPVTGTVVEVVSAVADNRPGEMNRQSLTGNTVVIRTQTDEYLLLAHLQQGSIVVAESDSIRVGDAIGNVGNSGNSSEPHLHIQLMTLPTMRKAVGIEMHFDELLLNGGGIARHYAPVRTNIIAKPVH